MMELTGFHLTCSLAIWSNVIGFITNLLYRWLNLTLHGWQHRTRETPHPRLFLDLLRRGSHVHGPYVSAKPITLRWPNRASQ